jgi:hypothetical protein
MPFWHGQLARKITFTVTQKVPLRANGDQGKPRFGRYQIKRRGLIAQLLKPKPVR